MVITVPGIAKVTKIDRGGLSAVLPEEEKETLRLNGGAPGGGGKCGADRTALSDIAVLSRQYY